MTKAATKSAKAAGGESNDSKNSRVQSEFPKHSLEQAMRVCLGLANKNAGKPLPPLETAAAIDMSPGSSDFRIILSSSLKYGLTAGSYKSDRVSVESLGRRVAEPVSAEDKRSALISAAFVPESFRKIYEYFKGKKLPEPTFFENTVVREFGIPREHAKKCVEIFAANMEYVGLVKDLPSGKWLSTDGAVAEGATQSESTQEAANENGDEAPSNTAVFAATTMPTTVQKLSHAAATVAANNKVFIAHGKNGEILPQLKDLLTFGGFEPLVSKERESTAEPVPQKVIREMSLCSAAVINVASEKQLVDKEGKSHHVLNENVLIEIGAAMALYDKNFILLVEKGVVLPSDLQGLYRCDYEGGKLDYDATMKLLKTFSLFRKH